MLGKVPVREVTAEVTRVILDHTRGRERTHGAFASTENLFPIRKSIVAWKRGGKNCAKVSQKQFAKIETTHSQKIPTIPAQLPRFARVVTLATMPYKNTPSTHGSHYAAVVFNQNHMPTDMSRQVFARYARIRRVLHGPTFTRMIMACI